LEVEKFPAIKDGSGVQVKHFPCIARGVLARWTAPPFVCKALDVCALDDGTYDAVVVDAAQDADGVMHIELTVSSGAHRGDVVKVAARDVRRSWIDLLGSPATLTVEGGTPRVDFE
jgi:hypothetical protein